MKPKPPGQRRPGARRSKPALLEGKAVARKVSHNFPVFFPTRLPSGAYFVESNPYEHVVDPRVYHFKDATNGEPARRLPDGGELELPDGTHYFGFQGIKGWSDPPILDNPSETRTIQGREYDDLHRRRPGQADRLAPREQLLLGGERPAQHAHEQPDGQPRSLHQGADTEPEAEAESKSGRRVDGGREGADRRDRGRLGRPGDRCLLRRARPSGDRARHRRREGRRARPRRDRDPRAGPRGAGHSQRGAAHLHDRDGRGARCCRHPLRLRRHAADAVRRRRPLARAHRRRGARRRRGPGPGHEEHRPGGDRGGDRSRARAGGRLRLLPGVPQGGLGGRGLHASRPGRDRRRCRRRGGRRTGWRRCTSRSAASSCGRTWRAPR